MPHALLIIDSNIVAFDPSRPQPFVDGWTEVTPEQFSTARALDRPQWIDGQVVEGDAPAPVEPTPDLTSQLHAAFTTLLTEEQQAAFAVPYAVVRTHVESGNLRVAANFLAGVEGPDELVPVRDGMVAMIESFIPAQ